MCVCVCVCVCVCGVCVCVCVCVCKCMSVCAVCRAFVEYMRPYVLSSESCSVCTTVCAMCECAHLHVYMCEHPVVSDDGSLIKHRDNRPPCCALCVQNSLCPVKQ